MERTILHIDINHCYAQIEEMLDPQLKKVPMVVGGFEEKRHGIMLAKNLLAKKYGLKTGQPLRDCLKICPRLVVVPPKYDAYIFYTDMVKDIYREYCDHVESFGLDEAWLDVTESSRLFGTGKEIAEIIQKRVLDEVGLTISIGVSYNKIFAKLGSDLVKPSGLTIITKHNLKEIVWPLPVEDLLYVGKATKAKLNKWGIITIGQLAAMNLYEIKRKLGKWGEYIWTFANGKEHGEVQLNGFIDPVKSIGNSITTVKDIENMEQAKHVYYVLCESVASRLRDAHLQGTTIAIHIRNTDLSSFSRQCKSSPTNVSSDIIEHVMMLLKNNYDFHKPLRSVGVSVSGLQYDHGYIQETIFLDAASQMKTKNIENTMDEIRNKFGFHQVKRCSLLLDEELTDFNPKGDHIIFPTGYF